jgi:uncharacterized protein
LDPRQPLIFETRALAAGSIRELSRTAPAPADLGSGLVGVPAGAELDLDVQLEGVSEGVLVTATISAPLAGECARCLEPFTSATRVRLRELYCYEQDDEDGYCLQDGMLDLEPALRDALVLELPLAPLCAEDCAGLCAECGARLADASPSHDHETPGGTSAPG